eukprot:GEMP01044388.1.p2 GENE.GEMP01044388.1~~GEMP01044388.1.p2  ORF type:complete len:218 (+),score=47.43 GEMP01044388.1:86-739(+)
MSESTDTAPFDVDRLIALYRDCASDLGEDGSGDVDFHKFAVAMRELCKVFAGLGKAFSFAFSDLDSKTAHIEEVIEKDASKNNFHELLEMDKAAGNVIPKDTKGMSNMRAINRMAWVSLFVKGIFDKMSDPKNESLKVILQESYEQTLKLYHTWLVKKAVGAAFMVSPTKKDFLKSINVTETQVQSDDTKEYVNNSQKIVDKIKQYHETEGLPWIFE